MGIFSSIGASVAGGIVGAIADPITKITGQIADTRVRLEQEKNSEKRIALEEQKASLEAKRDVLIAESGDKTNRLMRALIALGPTVLLLKVFIFDKTLGQWLDWRTDALSPELWQVVMVVIGFYFVDSIAMRFKR